MSPSGFRDAIGKTEADAVAAAKSSAWKLAVALWMKTHTQAANGWLSRKLGLGAPAAFSRNLTHFRRLNAEDHPDWKVLASISATCPLFPPREMSLDRVIVPDSGRDPFAF